MPDLHKECLTWLEATLSQPSGDNKAAIGAEDQALNQAILQGEDDVEGERKRKNILVKLEELLRRKVLLSSIDPASTLGLSLTKAFQEARATATTIAGEEKMEREKMGAHSLGHDNGSFNSAVGERKYGGATEVKKTRARCSCVQRIFFWATHTFIILKCFAASSQGARRSSKRW